MMKLTRIFQLLILCAAAVPASADTLTLTFRYDDPGRQQIRVFVPAVFNNWGSNVNGQIATGDISRMSYDSVHQAWVRQWRLAVDSSYAYKYYFQLDSSGSTWEWIADPLNSVLDNSGYGNSLMTVTDPMLFEPRITSFGIVSSVRAGLFSTSPFRTVRLILDSDTVDVFSSYDSTSGLLDYTLPGPRTVGALRLLAVDGRGRSVSQQWSFSTTQSGSAWENEVFYQIFPRSFYDSNGDSIGDFNGISQKLDYLRQLGVTAVWLNPIVRSRAYHNYFADSFDSTDPGFGSNADFTNLVRAVHAHGMKILIDMETQYVSGHHPWYTSSLNNPASPYTPYIWYKDAGNSQPESFSFTGYNGEQITAVTVRMTSPQSLAYQRQLFLNWIDPNHDGKFDDGVDGFRIDHIMDNLDGLNENVNLFSTFWKPLFDTLRSVNPNVFSVGEQADWGDYGTTTLTQSGIDAVFTIPLMFGIRTFDKATIASQIGATIASLPAGKHQFLIIENHDVDRFASTAGNPARTAAGAALNLTLPGIPCLYYGQEIGMLGVKGNWGSDGNDIPDREAMKWNALRSAPGTALWYANTGPWWTGTSLHDNDGRSVQEEQPDTASLWNYYARLIAVRKSSIALRHGAYIPLTTTDAGVIAFGREYTGDSAQMVAVLTNLTNSARSTSVDISPMTGIPGHPYFLTDMLGSRQFVPVTSANVHAYSVTLSPGESVIALVAASTAGLSMTADWNLVSLPLTVPDGRTSALFPGAVSKAFAYLNDGYLTVDTLSNGPGYWIKYDSAAEVTIIGTDRVVDTISLAAGWNLVGTLAHPTAALSVQSIPGGLQTSPFYKYAGGYTTADTLQPGAGYWIKAGQPGKIVLNAGSGPASRRVLRMTIRGELPPPPPGVTGKPAIPHAFSLEQNFPNPFNPSTKIRYSLPAAAQVSLRVYNVLGGLVATLAEGVQNAGEYSVEWNARDNSSGVYIVRLQAGAYGQARKLMLLK